MKVYKNLRFISVSFLVAVFAIFSFFNVWKLFAQPVKTGGSPVPKDATCYFAGPVEDRGIEIKDLHKSLQQLEDLYKEGKINKETYMKRKEDIEKQLESLEVPDNN